MRATGGLEQENRKHLKTEEGVSRRTVVAGLLAAVAASTAEATAKPDEEVARAAAALAASMKALHGGEWSVRVSHRHGYITVSRD
jgi:hypothetical protein